MIELYFGALDLSPYFHRWEKKQGFFPTRLSLRLNKSLSLRDPIYFDLRLLELSVSRKQPLALLFRSREDNFQHLISSFLISDDMRIMTFTVYQANSIHIRGIDLAVGIEALGASAAEMTAMANRFTRALAIPRELFVPRRREDLDE